ncbi:hypothetical protein CLDAP_27980 [Caldilinea aerophila DSM 14535 = NBRC 104270]|uniref:Uncharacterized protein n=1 Tax=Caldilinea aerophila (strain DSM 14535 / JCM 11387 / NBRC 104270 / STL-6-O1) TaxID=926550 RepID=I0I6F0_CALAS|nr:hypothetical protein CLDAP_27980 [Caldilinea aerophila DSM 14535 = NBRC 104270]
MLFCSPHIRDRHDYYHPFILFFLHQSVFDRPWRSVNHFLFSHLTPESVAT